ncbi:MAG: phage protease [Desulfovibrionaceae bacterium]
MAKKIQIMKAGTHQPMGGGEVSFSEADLAACAAAYDPARHEAPLVVGHPAGNAPAYGWVTGLSSEAGLVAEVGQVNPEFAELVRQGAFKKVSASFYTPDSPANPVPGGYYLRHVGFLGAQPPAVKGLAPVEFADDAQGCVTVEFGELEVGSALRAISQILRKLKNWLIAEQGQEKADDIIEEWQLTWLQDDAAVAAHDGYDANDFGEAPDTPGKEAPMKGKKKDPAKAPDSPKPAEAAAGEYDFAEQRERIAALEARTREFEERARRAEATAEVKACMAAGRLTPAQAAGLAEFMAGLGDEEVVEFGEGDEAAAVSPRTFMSMFLDRLPQQVAFGEVSAGGGEPPADMDPQLLARRTREFQEAKRAAGIEITTTEAMDRVLAGEDA